MHLLVLIDELPGNAAARNAGGWEDCLDLLAGRKPAEAAWQARFAQYRAAELRRSRRSEPGG